MQLPDHQPRVLRSGFNRDLASRSIASEVTPQSCNPLACIAAVAKCASSSNPIECILSEAPHCLDCLP
jgi:hypothetical protein